MISLADPVLIRYQGSQSHRKKSYWESLVFDDQLDGLE